MANDENLSANDLNQLKELGINPAQVKEQIFRFEKGTQYTRVEMACDIDRGISALSEGELHYYAESFEAATAEGRVTKFVPASGAATRMFKSPLALLASHEELSLSNLQKRVKENPKDPEAKECLQIIEHWDRFAFTPDLKSSLAKKGIDWPQDWNDAELRQVFRELLDEAGLNYASLPKALLMFHYYPGHPRSPLEEHLVEAEAYAKDATGICRLHLTVSSEHLELVKEFAESIVTLYESSFRQYKIEYSVQDPASQTIAVDLQNQAFRDSEGKLLFRPAGHGAILANLEMSQGDLVFIKNIDNLVPDHLKASQYLYKKAMGGLLAKRQGQCHLYLHQLESANVTDKQLTEIETFLETKLCRRLTDEQKALNNEAKTKLLYQCLYRPLRVCAMVENTGEPGGGPFWVQLPDGSLGLQIAEPAQIDPKDEGQQMLLKTSKYFNPTDLICALRDHHGRPFALNEFRDVDSGFITQKSKDGKALKALELPGLWNGSMAYWNSIFIVAPVSTFNPVKTLNDLLRPEHQPNQSIN